jgi:hypothetical protein
MKGKQSFDILRSLIIQSKKIDIINKSQKYNYIRCRSLINYVLYNYVELNYSDISRLYKNYGRHTYNHDLVRHSILKFPYLCKQDKDVLTLFKTLTENSKNIKSLMIKIKMMNDMNSDYINLLYDYVDKLFDEYTNKKLKKV